MEIIKAYEILRSHGFDFRSIFQSDKSVQALNKQTCRGDGANPKSGADNVLQGNTIPQLHFLSQLIASGREKNNESDLNNESVLFEQPGSKLTERGGERLENPIRVLEQEQSQDVQKETTKTFKEALGVAAQPEENSRKLKALSKPKQEGGNIVIQLEVEDYRDGVRDL